MALGINLNNHQSLIELLKREPLRPEYSPLSEADYLGLADFLIIKAGKELEAGLSRFVDESEKSFSDIKIPVELYRSLMMLFLIDYRYSVAHFFNRTTQPFRSMELPILQQEAIIWVICAISARRTMGKFKIHNGTFITPIEIFDEVGIIASGSTYTAGCKISPDITSSDGEAQLLLPQEKDDLGEDLEKEVSFKILTNSTIGDQPDFEISSASSRSTVNINQPPTMKMAPDDPAEPINGVYAITPDGERIELTVTKPRFNNSRQSPPYQQDEPSEYLDRQSSSNQIPLDFQSIDLEIERLITKYKNIEAVEEAIIIFFEGLDGRFGPTYAQDLLDILHQESSVDVIIDYIRDPSSLVQAIGLDNLKAADISELLKAYFSFRLGQINNSKKEKSPPTKPADIIIQEHDKLDEDSLKQQLIEEVRSAIDDIKNYALQLARNEGQVAARFRPEKCQERIYTINQLGNAAILAQILTDEGYSVEVKTDEAIREAEYAISLLLEYNLIKLPITHEALFETLLNLYNHEIKPGFEAVRARIDYRTNEVFLRVLSIAIMYVLAREENIESDHTPDKTIRQLIEPNTETRNTTSTLPILLMLVAQIDADNCRKLLQRIIEEIDHQKIAFVMINNLESILLEFNISLSVYNDIIRILNAIINQDENLLTNSGLSIIQNDLVVFQDAKSINELLERETRSLFPELTSYQYLISYQNLQSLLEKLSDYIKQNFEKILQQQKRDYLTVLINVLQVERATRIRQIEPQVELSVERLNVPLIDYIKSKLISFPSEEIDTLLEEFRGRAKRKPDRNNLKVKVRQFFADISQIDKYANFIVAYACDDENAVEQAFYRYNINTGSLQLLLNDRLINQELFTLFGLLARFEYPLSIYWQDLRRISPIEERANRILNILSEMNIINLDTETKRIDITIALIQQYLARNYRI